ncbi:hypothetical protein EDD15DRAFT_1687712 [Pisolithus albus]|nr:hypothetical protein EDD15DRAFT_1687712 [Pisolithus albus]
MDVHKALQLLHRVDWVHHVIGGSNILRASEMSKLADLEYAKPMDSNTTHEVRTGTLDFMACEVKAQGYLFQPRGGKRRREDKPLRKVFKCPFKFNPLHDMESLWWIATWTLFYHVDQEGGRPSSEQITQFHELFPGWLDSASRTNAFLTALEYEVLPASFHDAGDESMPPAYANPLEKLNAIFTECLASAFAASENIEIFSPNAKRRQADPTPDTRNAKQPKRDDSPEHSNDRHE